MYAQVHTAGLFGLNAFPVDVEIEASTGLESFDIVGLADASVRESRDRIKSAFRVTGVRFPKAKVLINLAPADTKKSGSGFDLAITMALLRILEVIKDEALEDSAFFGEVALNGDIRPINGILPLTILAKKQGYKRVFVPADNAKEASCIRGIEVYGASHIRNMILHFNDRELIEQSMPYEPVDSFFGSLDFKDVKGQQTAKFALEIAAAGGHNVLMIGAPGSGKSMLAKRIPSILPRMTFDESIEATNIHSVAGLVDKEEPLIIRRPFRSPHHTVSTAGLAGGGGVPRPGEVSLAHGGVLFLDELPEFSRQALELLRQPLEDKKVTISRAAGSVTYPCSFMLIAAMNPCPCGYFGHPSGRCKCTMKQIHTYLSKISGPLLDRFDLHVDVPSVDYNDLSSDTSEEPSEAIRQRVQAARDIQNKRFEGTAVTCNANITPDLMKEVCVMNDKAKDMLGKVFDKLGLSARAYDKILKVARTLADMSGREVIDSKDIGAAVQFRSLDRKYWSV
ncbi:MAG: YifB family Mg chelatase-like AAA ATPase [Ruminococcus sp.]|nr:YifB family Mg chelatase-like AAA ATPase [Ruminococcus sp.]